MGHLNISLSVSLLLTSSAELVTAIDDVVLSGD
jgi:hypothetical protein